MWAGRGGLTTLLVDRSKVSQAIDRHLHQARQLVSDWMVELPMIRASVSASLLWIAFLGSASLSADLGCRIEPLEGTLNRLLFPSGVSFLRSGEVVATGSLKNRATRFTKQKFLQEDSLHKSDTGIRYEVRAVGNDEASIVFYEFIDRRANGTIAFGSNQLAPVLRLYFVNEYGAGRSLGLEYENATNTSDVLDDVVCILDGGIN